MMTVSKGYRKPNRVTARDGHAVLYDLRNHEILVDFEDLPQVLEHTWYAVRVQEKIVVKTDRGQGQIQLHRYLTGAAPGEHIDYRNGNGLDNRCANLRRLTPQQIRAKSRPATGYKGVHSVGKRWRAEIMIEGRTHSLGSFVTAEGAARAYNRAALAAFGEFAYLNPVPEQPSPGEDDKSPGQRRGNPVEVRGDHAVLFDSKGNEILIDLEDLGRVRPYTWFVICEEGRLVVKTHCVEGHFQLHRYLAQPPEGCYVDFRNSNRLDCRRENLRLFNPFLLHGKKLPLSRSGYKGVGRQGRRWRAYISRGGKQVNLGTYDTPEEAALAYNKAALEQYGEFAFLNDLSSKGNPEKG